MKTVLAALGLLFAIVPACSSGGAVTVSDGVDGGSHGDGGNGGNDGGSADAHAKDGDAHDGAGGACHADADCTQGFQLCIGPGQALCGGPAPLHECNTDDGCADSGPNRLCVTSLCGGTSCQDKCTSDAACVTSPAGLETCSLATGRCITKACTANSCPIDYACSPNSATGCERKRCAADGECSGSCINGRCWSGPGKCVPIPA